MRWLIMLVMCWENNKGYFEKKSEESNRFSDFFFTPIDFFFNRAEINYLFEKVYRESKTNLFFLNDSILFQKLRISQNFSEFIFIYCDTLAWIMHGWWISDLFWFDLRYTKSFWFILIISVFLLSICFFWYDLRNAHKAY